MKRTVTAVLFVVAIVAAPAHAQFQPGPYGGPGYSPPVSPYLNLLRRGSDPAINYYGIVRPELSFQRSIIGLQQQVNAVGAQAAADTQGLSLVSTGHPIVFSNYSHYYGVRVLAADDVRAEFTTSAPMRSGSSALACATVALASPPLPPTCY